VALTLLGGIVGLDAVSCPQAMLSRPLVAGALAGAVLGDPVKGLWVGVLLELLTLRQLPVGAARQWDAGPAAVAAAAAYAPSPEGPAALTAAVGLGVLIGWIGEWSIHGLRHMNAGVVGDVERRSGDVRTLERLHLAALGLDFTRAVLLTLLGVSLAVALTTVFPAGSPALRWVAYGVVGAAALALGAVVRTMAAGRAVWVAFGAGAGASLLLWLWLS
jgi:PTS system mannose-specific IIC component